MKALTMTLAATLVACAPFASHAQEKWPTQNITFLVPFPPGGPTDIMARLLSTPLGAKLGTTVVVENRAGASGNIGSAAVARGAIKRFAWHL